MGTRPVIVFIPTEEEEHRWGVCLSGLLHLMESLKRRLEVQLCFVSVDGFTASGQKPLPLSDLHSLWADSVFFAG